MLYGLFRPRAVGVVWPDGSWTGVETALDGAFGGQDFRCSGSGEASDAGARFGRLWLSPGEVGERFGALVVSTVAGDVQNAQNSGGFQNNKIQCVSKTSKKSFK